MKPLASTREHDPRLAEPKDYAPLGRSVAGKVDLSLETSTGHTI